MRSRTKNHALYKNNVISSLKGSTTVKKQYNYFAIEIMNVILCIILLLLSFILFIDIKQNQELIGYILLIGACINLFKGFRGMNIGNSRRFLLPVSIVLLIMSLLSFLNFGGI